MGVAFFGVLAATFGWISGGRKIGFAVVFGLSLCAVLVMVLRDHVWALAVVLLLLGVAYGYAASRGVGKAFVQLPILTPYFIMAPPALFTDPPALDAKYFIGVIVVMNLTGLWAMLVLHLATGKRTLTPVEVADKRVPLAYGPLLGLIAAAVMVIGTSIELKSHWVWVILTLHLLVDPTKLINSAQMWGRLGGTFAGFGIVAGLALVGVPDIVLQMLAIPALWLCVTFMVIKKPYWEYVLFLTLTVVLLNSKEVNTLVLDAERFVFTLVGAALGMLLAWLLKRVIFHATSEAKHSPLEF